jgi:hypothetical protein
MPTDDPNQHFLDEMRRSRAVLEEQIKQGQFTIEKSKELFKKLDDIITGTPKISGGTEPSG